ncbi:MAG TPA: DUF2587 domain-containing protein [Microthrixaceae bacterium]|jgi:hypothetical protein|nr:DUF2587 domain-containing protein [Microthrixaceae bacterium]
MSDQTSDPTPGTPDESSLAPAPPVAHDVAAHDVAAVADHEVLEPDAVTPPAAPMSGAVGAGAGVGAAPLVGGPVDAEGDEEVPDVNSPAKIIRIGAMVKQLLEEVRNTTLDEASREQLRDIYERSVAQLTSALSPELAAELTELSFDFSDGDVPSEVELRMAQSQLVGWLEGLFHGIQAALVAQQMSARQQLEGMRGELPQGPGSGMPSGPGPGYI